MKTIAILGIGKLGLAFALTLEKFGYNVVGVDISQEYVDAINERWLKSFEPNVEEYLKSYKNFRATTSLREGVEHSDIIFIMVATPSLPNGRYDHSQIERILGQLGELGMQERTKHLIIACTVMPGYCNDVAKVMEEYKYTVSYNPEFIAQGSIIYDQTNPDMVLIGEANIEIGDIIENIYCTFTENNPVVKRMTPLSAEITKLALNCFITTKISFANMICDIAKKAGAEPDKILSAIGSDSRIGNKYLGYGFGYGGPCFPRDNRALAIFADEHGIEAIISKATDGINRQHLEFQVNEFMNNNHKITPVIIDGVSFKKGSVIIEESQQLAYAVQLAKNGYKVVVKDHPEVIRQVKELYDDLFEYQPSE